MAATLVDIRAAAGRIAGVVHRTPVHTCRGLDAWVGRPLALKCETFQKGGSFKIRGALNAVRCLTEAQRSLGVITHSSGNFAQGLALAARAAGVHATVVMPRTAPAVKRAAVAGYGAEIVLCEPTLRDRIATMQRLAEASGATPLSPSDHPDVIAGQGTCGLELFEQAPELEVVLVPLGGGGLLSGVALAYRELAPGVRVIGVEPAGADDGARSRAAGRRLGHPDSGPDTICDGLRTELGVHTWPVVRDVVDDVVRVDDTHTRLAVRLLMERAKLVVEPSAAITLGALLAGVVPGEPVPTGLVLSGGNVDLDAILSN